MSNDYVIPFDVTSPRRQWRLVSVVYDRGEGKAAVATGLWDGKPGWRSAGTGQRRTGSVIRSLAGCRPGSSCRTNSGALYWTGFKRFQPQKYPVAKEFIMNAIVLTNTIPLP